jgi:trk system potassium uptake protein TrkH
MMRKPTVRWNALFVFTLLLSIVSLYIEQMEISGLTPFIFTNLVDLAILFILVAEIIVGFKKAPYRLIYLKRNAVSLVFSVVFTTLFIYNKYITIGAYIAGNTGAGLSVLLIRNFFLVLKVFSRYRRIASFIEGLNMRPALTIMLSFLFVILAGTWLLMMPFTVRSGSGLPFLDALFTATSAVCVTGLIVVDTAAYFSLWGQVVILILIQVGGLGIMVLSYFTLFVLGRRISVEQKSLVAYMLSEDDMGNLKNTLKSIIGITVLIEGIGALVLAGAGPSGGASLGHRVFFGVFHAVSAFCNAGFAVFGDSLESFSGRPPRPLDRRFAHHLRWIEFRCVRESQKCRRISIRETHCRPAEQPFRRHPQYSHRALDNRHPDPFGDAGVLCSGTQRCSLTAAPWADSIWPRSSSPSRSEPPASIRWPFGSLSTGVIIAMVIFMFIGGASGSTAGGIKVNTLAVLLASVRSAWRNDTKVVLRSHTVDGQSVNRAFLIFLFGVVSVVFGGFILSVTEDAPFRDILFETVSAFATVGLSTGLTSSLSSIGKIVIITLMFIGRLGPLTVLAASSSEQGKLQVTYPRAEIAIG